MLYYQPGLFTTCDFDATFRRLRFQGFRRQDGYGKYAAIRLGPSVFNRPLNNSIVIEDCEMSGCDDGILGGGPGQKVLLRRCHFHDNGNGTGRCHNLYVGEVDELVADNLLPTGRTIGHLLKSRAAATTIRDRRLLRAAGTESACLDVPNAGVLAIDGLVCEKSPGSDASWIIHYSGESQEIHNPSAVKIRHLTLVAPTALRRHPSWGMAGFVNQSGDGPAASARAPASSRSRRRRCRSSASAPASAGSPAAFSTGDRPSTGNHRWSGARSRSAATTGRIRWSSVASPLAWLRTWTVVTIPGS